MRGRTSPLGRNKEEEEGVQYATVVGTKKSREEREERRWKIAEELRETEKSYAEVLKEIDEVSRFAKHEHRAES